MAAIESCRTAALGGHVEVCDRCSQQRVWFNSCSDRHCPQCQSLARARWIEDRQSELLGTDLGLVDEFGRCGGNWRGARRQSETVENLLCGGRGMNGGSNPHAAVTMWTFQHV